MAIDFSKVKTITIPEGSVKKITDSNGSVLWKEKSAGWHTVWEGNKKIGYGGQTSRFVFATEPYSDALKIRVSFSDLVAYSTGGDDQSVYYTPSNRKSPVTYESFDSGSTTLVSAYVRNPDRNANYSADLYYNKVKGEIFGDVSDYYGDSYCRAYIVITKIEVYS